MVPSSACVDCTTHQKYNASLSSTYKDPDQRAGFGSLWHIPHYSGPLAQDTLHIAGTAIIDQLFANADSVFYVDDFLDNDKGWDGYLGLAGSPNGSAAGITNVFQNMVTSGVLDQNIFALKLSRGADDPGEIIFGGVNHERYTGGLIELAIVQDREDLDLVRGRWKVPVLRIGMGEGEIMYEDYVAILESDFPFIALPADDVYLLHRYLGMKVRDGIWSIDCLERDSLEALTITLGGHDFVIGPYEYTIEANIGGQGEVRCVSAFLEQQRRRDAQRYIILGSAFLRNFYGVFNADAGTVSLGKVATRNRE